MSRMRSGAQESCGDRDDSQQRTDLHELCKELRNNQCVMREQMKAIEARIEQIEQALSREQGRTSNVEESVRRALDEVMPKVEELLARHQSPQSSRETALRHVAPPGASPGDAHSLPQQSPHAAGGGSLPTETVSASNQPAEGDGEGPPTGASPPCRASASSDPPASLREAAERGDAAAVQCCLASGAPIDARDKRGNTALHIAASNGHSAVVDALIAKGSAVNRYGFKARTPLHCAAAAGHEATVARLVAAGANVNLPDADGATAAALAAQKGHVDVLLRLLDEGTSVEAADKKGMTLLMYAVEGGDLQTVVHLLENGASPIKVDKYNESSLLLGSKKGNGDLVGEMLKVAAAADIEHLKRCLLVAGSADVVWSFVDADRDLVLGPAGGEALERASGDGRLEAMEALLGVGAGDEAARGKALRAAAIRGHRGSIAALLDEGINVSARDCSGHTALYLAAANGHVECIEELLQRGAKKEELTEGVLVNAASSGRLDVVKVLLRLRLYTNASREQALWVAAIRGHRGCVAALLDDGVDVNARGSYQWTALHEAASWGHADCVKELLQRGANKELKDSYGHTALTLAKKQANNQACIDILTN